MPGLSPDGKRLAFVYRGDIWIAPSSGGRATPLTQHLETDAYPVFSPDGKWIAFASRRNGNWDIYAVPSEGGAARQLTFHAGSEITHGWSPDGKHILFSAKRDTPNYSIYSLDVSTLRSKVLCEDYAKLDYATYSPDGETVAYARYGFHWTRARYSGSAAAQMHWLDVARQNHGRALTETTFQHLWPRFMPDGKRIVTVTVAEATPNSGTLDHPVEPLEDNPKRTPNLWFIDLEGKRKQATTFVGVAVRCPSVAAKSGDIAFAYGPDPWLLNDGNCKARKLSLLVAADEQQTTRRREKLTSGVTEAEPSPDGKTFAFGLRGDIWTISVEKPKGIAAKNAEFAKRLTDWVGDDSDFSWSPDGKKLYFTSDREFNTRLYELDVESLKIKSLWNRTEDITGPRVSPDGQQLGFWVSGPEGGLHTLSLTNQEVRRIVKLPGPQWRGVGGGEYSWSP